MAANEFMPDPTIAQTDPERSEGNDRFPEVTCKKDARRLHGKATVEAAVHARADTPVSSAACCELYSRIRNRFIPLSGEWLPKAGFPDGMPVKIRVMPGCIIITPQNTRELWGCLEGMSVVNINKKRVQEWLKTFPGALNDTGNIPTIRRTL
ncbi:SymE family type I addiction module toxin [Enterobacter sp. 638]|uniref:Toxin SymE-like domain-containing protein n=1 Tax=Enterobacter sp. (strain 638) TaxID=399742 RepID=A0A9J9GDT2_ENT38|nr:SymE family type I addiction module toxin [Enterobacter sp. 638]ABP59132.1 hypothetical protein Ent638_0444 [Enterobacter sp. 638]